MAKIICLLGKSCSGKDTIYKKLIADESLDLVPLVTYTTRPLRSGEQEGREYHFTDEAGFNSLKEQGRSSRTDPTTPYMAFGDTLQLMTESSIRRVRTSLRQPEPSLLLSDSGIISERRTPLL